MKHLLKGLFSFLSVVVVFSVLFFVSVFFVSVIEKQDNVSEITQQSAALSYPAAPEPVLADPVPSQKQGMERIFYMSRLREKEGIESLKKYANKIDIVAPQFYEVTSDLKLSGGLDLELKELIEHLSAQAGKNLKVMPLVANSDFKQEIIHNLLTSQSAQENVISGLVALAKKNNYVGWQFDFENISYLDRDLYSDFVEKTAMSFHKENLILSVAAVSRNTDFEDTNIFKNWSGVFDYARLAKAVDFISLMTYDDPNSVGPVASLPFINGALDYVKDKIPSEKLSLGIPLYYWSWSKNPPKKIVIDGTYERFSYIISNFEHALGYDKELGASWLSYLWENEQYLVWFQGKQVFESRLDIIKQKNLRGFSAWVLGIEDPSIWATIN